jgi:hypothetical protein
MSYAGHDGLDNLIVIYDSNDVTLDKMADFTQSEVIFLIRWIIMNGVTKNVVIVENVINWNIKQFIEYIQHHQKL